MRAVFLKGAEASVRVPPHDEPLTHQGDPHGSAPRLRDFFCEQGRHPVPAQKLPHGRHRPVRVSNSLSAAFSITFLLPDVLSG